MRRRGAAPLLLTLATLAVAGCSQEAKLRSELDRRAGYTADGGSFQLVACGWVPPGPPGLVVTSAKLGKTTGDDEHGSLEIELAARSAEGTPFTCEGRVFTEYAWMQGSAGKSSSHYHLHDYHRVGAPSPILAEVDKRATTGSVDAEVMATFNDEWKLPDGSFGFALRVTIAEPGMYAVDGFERRTRGVSVYQGGAIIEEGNGSGSLAEWRLASGEVLLLVAQTTSTPAPIRLHASKH